MFIRSEDLKRQLIDLYRRLIVKERVGIHMSDLDFPRKSLYDRLYPIEPDEASILRWVRGESAHSFFRNIFKNFPNARIEETKRFEVLGHAPVSSTPDVALVKMESFPIGDVIFEFKSTIGNQVAEHWVRRLHRYMAVNETQYGVLVVHYLLRNKLDCFPVELPVKKLAEIKDSVFHMADLFEKGLSTGINIFPKCPDWICRDCTHKVRCMQDFTIPSIKEVL
ncbi:MAG: hypothetical protein K6T73_07790 [Candidatus Bathyarchaeota archaeon]|nr:hypothetical protein [Candidatus Bathyarchaeota archaeon]